MSNNDIQSRGATRRNQADCAPDYFDVVRSSDASSAVLLIPEETLADHREPNVNVRVTTEISTLDYHNGIIRHGE